MEDTDEERDVDVGVDDAVESDEVEQMEVMEAMDPERGVAMVL